MSKTRRKIWNEKFVKNFERDTDNEQALSALGWCVLVVSECEAKSKANLTKTLAPLLADADRFSIQNK